eukprot:TRINITY_DN1869_c0_g2_i1.p1 TRINITY_DN1869_c0_g2~~TRINITY_DN1869_c0_g2_i1.p1  ORF type:complete len:427 (+),score=101.51 TRINITY_DN1869_c0_g2_i1:245-1525(+)
MDFKQFIDLHRAQLEGNQVPQELWGKLYAKFQQTDTSNDDSFELKTNDAGEVHINAKRDFNDEIFMFIHEFQCKKNEFNMDLLQDSNIFKLMKNTIHIQDPIKRETSDNSNMFNYEEFLKKLDLSVELKYYPEIQMLDLSEQGITNEDLSQIDFLNEFVNVQFLDLSNNYITDLASLICVLDGSNVRSITLTSNPVESPTMIETIENYLEQIEVVNGHWTKHYSEWLTNQLSVDNNTLTIPYVANPSHLNPRAFALDHFRSVETLDIRSCHRLRIEDVEKISECFTNLKHLKLSTSIRMYEPLWLLFSNLITINNCVIEKGNSIIWRNPRPYLNETEHSAIARLLPHYLRTFRCQTNDGLVEMLYSTDKLLSCMAKGDFQVANLRAVNLLFIIKEGAIPITIVFQLKSINKNEECVCFSSTILDVQ